MPTQKALLKAAYLSRLPENEKAKFTVHYDDRFLGLVDTTAEQFLESGIPEHRVRVMKKDEEIIWDRKNKYTTL